MYLSIVMYYQPGSSPTEFTKIDMKTFILGAIYASPWLESLSIYDNIGRVTNIRLRSSDIVEQLYEQISKAVIRGDTTFQLDCRPFQK